MVIPATVEEVDKRHATLSHTTGKNAVAGKGAGLENIRTVEIEDRLRLMGESGLLLISGDRVDLTVKGVRMARWARFLGRTVGDGLVG